MGRSKIDFFEIISGFFLLLVLFLILLIAAIGDHKIFLVLIGLFPSILTIMISLVIHEQYTKGSQVLWTLPLLTSGGFFALQYIPGFTLEQLDIPVLAGVTFVISIIYVILVFGVFRNKSTHKEQPKERIIIQQQPATINLEVPQVAQPTIEDIIHSIEDKSKALNFVIGRVYNKYHGGTSEMRDKLRVPAEWYNEFSLIGFGTDHIDYDKLQEIISKFELHLKNFEKKEIDLFKSKVTTLKNLIRDPAGSDKVIDVLDHNDKDPVRSYYEGAVKFCAKIQEQMEHNEVTLVENKYIPKDDDEEEEMKLSSGAADPKDIKKFEDKKDAVPIPAPPGAKQEHSDVVEIRRPKTGNHP